MFFIVEQDKQETHTNSITVMVVILTMIVIIVILNFIVIFWSAKLPLNKSKCAPLPDSGFINSQTAKSILSIASTSTTNTAFDSENLILQKKCIHDYSTSTCEIETGHLSHTPKFSSAHLDDIVIRAETLSQSVPLSTVPTYTHVAAKSSSHRKASSNAFNGN